MISIVFFHFVDEKIEVVMLRGDEDSLVIRDESLASLPVHKEWPM